MLYKEISKILGTYFFGFSLALCAPFLVGCYYQFWAYEQHPQPHSTLYFLYTIVICLLLAYLFSRVGEGSKGRIYRREGLASVAIIWVFTPALAALPFWLSGTIKNPVQAYFEATSGLTTTGATIMEGKKYDPYTGRERRIRKVFCGLRDTEYVYYGTIDPVRDPQTGEILYENIEAVGRALLFWRSFLQWLGGMGIIVLFVAILPALGVGGKVLLQAEVPGPIKDSLRPRIKETASQLWKIYLGLTALEITLLLWTNPKMEWLDAFVVTFSTLSTGGFSMRNNSIASYQSAATEWVLIVFMISGSINFSLYFHILKGKIYRLFEPEFFAFLAILLFACSFSAWSLVGTEKALLGSVSYETYSGAEAIRQGFFQTISAQTSTGFQIGNYDRWPYAIQTLLLILMYIGGMSGSTSGGIKVMRHYILFRAAQDKTELIFRPKTVRALRVGDRKVDANVVMTVLCYFLIFAAFAVLGTFLLVMDGIDPETALGVISCTINNAGMAFRQAGPLGSCAFLSNFGALVTSAWMILGRLEFFAILVIFVPAFWQEST